MGEGLSKTTLDICLQLVVGYQIPGNHPQIVQLAQTIETARQELQAAMQEVQDDAVASNGQAGQLIAARG